MIEVKESLTAVERKHKRFNQQQVIFISALERSQEQAHGRTEPVKTVLQVQRYMIHHCHNATDRSILSFFLEIVSDLGNVLKVINPSCRNSSSDALITCKMLLHPDSDISKLRAQYPHDEIMRLSCQTKTYFGGVVSVIPLALDLLRAACVTLEGTPTPSPSPVPAPSLTPTRLEHLTSPPSACGQAISQAMGERRTQSAQLKRMQKTVHTGAAWHAGKPAWRPPGGIRM